MEDIKRDYMKKMYDKAAQQEWLYSKEENPNVKKLTDLYNQLHEVRQGDLAKAWYKNFTSSTLKIENR